MNRKAKKQQPQDEQMQQMKYGGVPMYAPGGLIYLTMKILYIIYLEHLLV